MLPWSLRFFRCHRGLSPPPPPPLPLPLYTDRYITGSVPEFFDINRYQILAKCRALKKARVNNNASWQKQQQKQRDCFGSVTPNNSERYRLISKNSGIEPVIYRSVSKNSGIEPVIYRSISSNSDIEPALLLLHTVLLLGTVYFDTQNFAYKCNSVQ